MGKPKQSRDTKLITVYLSSKGVETKVRSVTDSSGKTIIKHFVYGSINGNPFEVECNSLVSVPEEVAHALGGFISKQDGDR